MRILICDHPDSMAPNHAREEAILRSGLEPAFGPLEVVVLPYQAVEHELFLAQLEAADALLTGFLPLPADVLRRAPSLRAVSINATGYDNVDLRAAKELGIAVMCIGEYCTQDVAEHTIALMLALHRNLKHFWRDVDERAHWSFDSAPPGDRLTERTLGIVGLGRIGSTVARMARGLGMRVLATDPFVGAAHAEAVGAELVSRGELLAASDIVSNHMNATPENVGYFDAAAFGAMTRRPIFLNTGRGTAVVEPDLVAALDSGQIRGAGLDVLTDETPALRGHPLTGRANVILTPHSAFFSTASIEALVRISCENLVHHFTGAEDKVFTRVV
ncbi:MAG: NAD(P)-dependent oxidoreductase [Dermatophilus congolensis]|nr:NAD(P)-dependent oxidoreductase [Dermatophilus congolensis]